MKLKRDKKIKGDIFLLLLVVLLALIGVVFVYSASNYNALKDYGNKYYFVSKQIVGVGIGLACMLFTANFNYKKYFKLGLPAYLIGIFLLCLVFVPGVGVESYGAKRWIGFAGVTLQPSEIAKFAYVFLCAGYLGKSPEKTDSFKNVLPIIIAGGVICFLIIIEPNMSITMCVGLLMILLLFASGVKIKHILIILIPIVLAVPVLIILEPYRLKRLYAFIDPWASPKGEGYQLIQSLYALGSGGWWGVGLFNSRQKYKYLPFSESDFILSVIGEEIGLVGVILLFAIIFLVVIKGFKIAGKSKDFYGYILSVGITGIFCIQAIINALVVTGSIPPTGLPLPLISSGNTSIIVFMAMFGVLYNVSVQNES